MGVYLQLLTVRTIIINNDDEGIDIIERLESNPGSFSDKAIEMLVRITQHSEARGKVQRIHYLACLIADERNYSPTE